MYIHKDKKQENITKNSSSNSSNNSLSLQLQNNRNENVAQRNLQNIIDSSEQVNQAIQIQLMANDYALKNSYIDSKNVLQLSRFKWADGKWEWLDGMPTEGNPNFIPDKKYEGKVYNTDTQSWEGVEEQIGDVLNEPILPQINKLILNLDEENKKINQDIATMVKTSEEEVGVKKISENESLNLLANNSSLILVCHGDPRLGENEPYININGKMTTGDGLAKRLKALHLPKDRTINIDITACQTGWSRRGTSFAEVFKGAMGGYSVNVRAPTSLSTTEEEGEMMLNLPYRSLMKNKQALMIAFDVPSTDELESSIEEKVVEKKGGLFSKAKKEYIKEVNEGKYMSSIEPLIRFLSALRSELLWYFEDTATANLLQIQNHYVTGANLGGEIRELIQELTNTDEITVESLIYNIKSYDRITREVQSLVSSLPGTEILLDRNNIPVEYQEL